MLAKKAKNEPKCSQSIILFTIGIFFAFFPRNSTAAWLVATQKANRPQGLIRLFTHSYNSLGSILMLLSAFSDPKGPTSWPISLRAVEGS